ncbi:MAG TPA: tetratricopeptide repeat protein [bacterium]|nr:tetratricopeptide repeat protein [bacterium]
MNRRLVMLLTGSLLFWVPLAFFSPSVDAFLLPKDLLGLVVGSVLAVLCAFQWPGAFRQAWVRVLLLFMAWMVVDGAAVGYSSLAVGREAVHFILWLGAAAGCLLLGEGEGTLEKMTAFALAAGSFMALHGLLQALGLHEAAWTTRFEGRAFSTLGNPDYLGGYFAALLPLAWVMTLRAKSHAGWWTFRVATMLLFVGLLVTRVRGSFLALGVAGLFLLAALVSPWGRGLWRANKGFVLATLAVALVGAGAFWFRHGGLSAFSLEQASFQQRLDTYRIAWTMVKDHPWCGVGLGHFALDFPLYQAKPWPQGGHPYIYSSHVHNEFLRFWAEGGTIGLVLFVLVLLYYVRGMVRTVNDPGTAESERTLLVGMGAGMAGLLGQSLTNFPLQVAPTAILFGFFLAGPFVLRRKAPEGTGDPKGGAAPVVVLALFFILGAWASREMAASIALRDTLGEAGLGHGDLAIRYGQRTVSLSSADPKAWSALGRAYRSAGQGDGALVAFQKAVALDPNDVEDRALMAQLLLDSGHPGDAVKFGREALAIAPNDLGALWTLAVSQFQSGDIQGAVGSFTTYASDSPSEYQPYLNLGVCYMRLGQREKAREAWEKAKALNPADPQADLYLKSLNQKTKSKVFHREEAKGRKGT